MKEKNNARSSASDSTAMLALCRDVRLRVSLYAHDDDDDAPFKGCNGRAGEFTNTPVFSNVAIFIELYLP